MTKRIVKLLGAALLPLVGVLVVKTMLYKAPEFVTLEENDFPEVVVDLERAVANMSAAVGFATVSHQDPAQMNRAAFEGFLEWIEKSYPLVHATMSREMASGLTPIYKWDGKNTEAKPVLLTAHYDVVPVPEGELGDWQHPPFKGAVDDEFVWGRGTIDDKIGVIGLLEAAESLIARGIQPERTIYFIFGHDEEVGGNLGAGVAVDMLGKRGVRMAWSLDEGSMVLNGVMPGVRKPVASINVAEKGYVTLDITASATGGHSSLPPRETAVGELAAAIDLLVKNPVPGGLTGASADFFDAVAPEMGFAERMLFANRWLFAPVLESILSGSASTNAMLRTTTAPTMLSGSIKENVLPTEAVATVNFRLHPRDTAEGVLAYVEGLIGNPNINVTLRGEPNPASPVSRYDVEGFQLLARAAVWQFGDVILVPGLTIAGTDTKHFAKISRDSYRFNPVNFGPEDLPRIHGINERVAIRDLENAIGFYSLLMQSIDG